MSGKKRSLCPECGKHASGNFCHHCGSTLGGKFCNQCGSEVSDDGKFCNQCGATVKGASAPRSGSTTRGGGARGGGASRQAAGAETGPPNNLPWWFAGIAMFGLILVVGWNMVQPAGPAAPAGGGVPAGAVNPNSLGQTDISQMSPREAADQLFNRVMSAAETGDSVGAQGFMPMAIQAYEMAQPLDMDGLYHLSLLQVTAAQFDRALATAQQMLEGEPNHTLALSAAAQAALGLGMTDDAEGYYQRLLDNIDTEMSRPLPEYQGHLNSFPGARAEAEAFLAGR
jgi:hypothetical protein